MPAYFRAINSTAGGTCTDEWGSKVYYAAAGQNRVDAPMDPPLDLPGKLSGFDQEGTPGVADAEWGVKVMSVAEAVMQSAARNVPRWTQRRCDLRMQLSNGLAGAFARKKNGRHR